MFRDAKQYVRDEGRYFQYLLEHKKLQNAVVSAYFVSEFLYLETRKCSYLRLS